MEKIEVKTDSIKTIKWNMGTVGYFSATIKNGELIDFRCYEKTSSHNPSVNSTNPEFLKCVRDAINDLLPHLEK